MNVRRERQKALDSRYELGKLQEQARRLEQKLDRIPPEILAQYGKSTSRQEKNGTTSRSCNPFEAEKLMDSQTFQPQHRGMEESYVKG